MPIFNPVFPYIGHERVQGHAPATPLCGAKCSVLLHHNTAGRTKLRFVLPAVDGWQPARVHTNLPIFGGVVVYLAVGKISTFQSSTFVNTALRCSDLPCGSGYIRGATEISKMGDDLTVPFAILRFEKCKSGGVTARYAHDERKKETYKSNPDINISRKQDNYHLTLPQQTYRREIQRLIKAAGCKTRKDSTVMVETLITASPDFLNGLS